jgi:acyl-CoA thioester hydrolase
VSAAFCHRLRVRYGECDSQGVVFNAHYLAFADLTLTELWRAAVPGGYVAMVREGIDMVVAEARVRFLAPARFDDELEIQATVTRLGTTGMSSTYRMMRGGEAVAEVDLRHVFVHADGSGTTPIPDAVREGLAPHLLEAVTGAAPARAG